MRPVVPASRPAMTRVVLMALAMLASGGSFEADAATVIRTGTVDVYGTVNIVTPTPTSDTISASVEVFTYDNVTSGSQVVFADTVTVTRSGDTATVKVDVPYKFIFDTTRVGSAKLTTTVTLYVNNTQAYATSTPVPIPASGADTLVTVHLAL